LENEAGVHVSAYPNSNTQSARTQLLLFEKNIDLHIALEIHVISRIEHQRVDAIHIIQRIVADLPGVDVAAHRVTNHFRIVAGVVKAKIAKVELRSATVAGKLFLADAADVIEQRIFIS
jgi:hypothetical protein